MSWLDCSSLQVIWASTSRTCALSTFWEDPVAWSTYLCARMPKNRWSRAWNSPDSTSGRRPVHARVRLPVVSSELVIAIDGPAGSGKSSVSKAVASRLGLSYLDTGAMYRAVTWAVLNAGVDPEDSAAVAALIEGEGAPVIKSGTDPTNPTICVDGTDVAEPIRGRAVTEAVSAVSAVPAVRRQLVELQRAHARDSNPGIVVEGRDIGSVVLPEAPLKIYLTADPGVRAQRRAAETDATDSTSISATEEALRNRDAKDSTRSVSPLTRADGAVEIDTTDLTFNQVVDAVVTLAGGAE